MAGEEIDRPDPKALPSQIPDAVLELAVKLDLMALDDETLRGLDEFRRASNYIAAGERFREATGSLLTMEAMIFLRDNTLLERDLTFDDIKPR